MWEGEEEQKEEEQSEEMVAMEEGEEEQTEQTEESLTEASWRRLGERIVEKWTNPDLLLASGPSGVHPVKTTVASGTPFLDAAAPMTPFLYAALTARRRI